MTHKHPRQPQPSDSEPSPFVAGGFRRIEHDRDRDLNEVYFDICDLSDRLQESVAALPDGPATRPLRMLARLQALQVEHLFAEADLLHAMIRIVASGRTLPFTFEDEPPQPP